MAEAFKSILGFIAGISGILSESSSEKSSIKELWSEEMSHIEYIGSSKDRENLKDDMRRIHGDISKAHGDYLKK